MPLFRETPGKSLVTLIRPLRVRMVTPLERQPWGHPLAASQESEVHVRMNSLGPWRLPGPYGKEAGARRLCSHQIRQVAEILWASPAPENADPTQTPLTKSPNVCNLGICPQWGNPALIHRVSQMPECKACCALGESLRGTETRVKGEVPGEGHSGGWDRRVT